MAVRPERRPPPGRGCASARRRIASAGPGRAAGHTDTCSTAAGREQRLADVTSRSPTGSVRECGDGARFPQRARRARRCHGGRVAAGGGAEPAPRRPRRRGSQLGGWGCGTPGPDSSPPRLLDAASPTDEPRGVRPLIPPMGRTPTCEAPGSRTRAAWPASSSTVGLRRSCGSTVTAKRSRSTRTCAKCLDSQAPTAWTHRPEALL